MNTKKKVLIVDDEEKSRLYLATILVELFPDFETNMASTPAEALFMLSKQSFDCLFLDVEMPGMTGLEMVSQLRQNVSQIPVIFVSAYKRADFIQSALRLNAVDYLDKPVDPYELERAVKKILLEETQTQIGSIYQNTSSKRFRLFTDKGDCLVAAAEIAYFKSEQRYSRAYFIDGTSDLIRNSLAQLITLLPSDVFLHVGRQFIVNLDYVKYFSKSNKTLTLIYNKERVELSRISPNVFPVLISKFGGR